MDPYFRVTTLRAYARPQAAIYAAMHQDYSEDFVGTDAATLDIDEVTAGDRAVKRLLAGERGHYGCLEHPQITLACGWFPHTVMQQARTHRVGISFDVQSSRYTSARIIDVIYGKRPVEEVYYLRPAGVYTDRNGARYEYTYNERNADLSKCLMASQHYAEKVEAGYAEEHARYLIPYAIRQHFVVSFNARAILHFMDLRAKANAELEIRQLCELMWPEVQRWIPQVAEWYGKHRLHKGKLAP